MCTNYHHPQPMEIIVKLIYYHSIEVKTFSLKRFFMEPIKVYEGFDDACIYFSSL